MALCTHKLGFNVTPEMFTECFLYYLSLNSQGGNRIDYNWATHASCYWVCDGITGGGQDNQAWELALAVQQHIRLEDYSSNAVKDIGSQLDISTKHWVCIANSCFEEVPPGTTTSLFFAPETGTGYVPFPNERFHQADQLRVLKLCRCTFNFSSPPFHCCRSLRFLGLDSCLDEQRQLGEEETGERAVETFQRLWVLDVWHTDWELDFPHETEGRPMIVAADIREVHVNKGRIWRSNFAWRRLPNLRKLRVVKPTRSWETGRQDEFTDMVKLELLDLSGNETMQVLPSLSGATGLKTLVLDGCVGLEHVGPQGLPPSLESFRLDTGEDEYHHESKAKISSISLAGCARLVDFRLCGSLPKLEELDLSHTALKMLDLTKVVTLVDDGWAVIREKRERVFLVGCEQLRSIRWPSLLHQLRLPCIDTRPSSGQEVARKPWPCDPLLAFQDKGEEEYCHVFVAVADMRFLESLHFLERYSYVYHKVKMILCWSSSTSKDDGRSCYKTKMGHEYSSSTGRVAAAGSPLQARSSTYHDVSTERQITTTLIDGSSCASSQFQPLDAHFEIGEGIGDVTDAVSRRGLVAITFVMNWVKSLHVHDSSSITTVYPERFYLSVRGDTWTVMDKLKWCRVERCPRLQTVFATDYALRAIHLHFCPRLRYVLLLSSYDDLSNQLETLTHILLRRPQAGLPRGARVSRGNSSSLA
ncbi:uncharacterized protein LOC120678458 isoform X1 [Panicum virgatum]|uniref:uncharacterized protein LOC120678458 isoform X1 n=1 Tax=Panicum virgatum TaxID=38727 RepID=UPI0019D5B42F|nr:uncharacterized protein LOC120678458 isoform X1 [Panicum virgatum]